MAASGARVVTIERTYFEDGDSDPESEELFGFQEITSTKHPGPAIQYVFTAKPGRLCRCAVCTRLSPVEAPGIYYHYKKCGLDLPLVELVKITKPMVAEAHKILAYTFRL